MIILESECYGEEHSEVNAELLKIIIQEANEPIILYGEARHLELIAKLIGDKKIKLKKYKLYSKSNLFRKIFSFSISLVGITKAIISNEKIIILAGGFFNIWITKILNKIFGINNAKIILHGELSRIDTSPSTFLRRIYWIRNSLYIFNSNKIKFFVLSERIMKKIYEKHGGIKKYFEFIELPYNYDLPNNWETKKIGENNSRPLRYLGIGVASVGKRSHYVYKLYEMCQRIKVENINYEIRQAGKFVDKMMYQYINEEVKTVGLAEHLSRSDYEKEIENSDFLLLFYPEKSYEYIFSGIICDCIKYEKPILCLRNEIFIDANEKYGEIAIIFDNLQEMAEFITGNTGADLIARYEKMHKNILSAKEKLIKLSDGDGIRKLLC